MVFFTCNGCNESLKKNQCEKHISMCRRAQSLSCVDCGKDFWGKDYQTHVKCISEEEKYSGKDYKPKANANKGEKKQEQWISLVQEAIGRASTSPQLCSVLRRLLAYTNIPRSKAKFENFIRNSMKLHNEKLIAQMWAVLEENKPPAKAQPSAADKAQPSAADLTPPAVAVASIQAADSEAADADVTAVKLSKREKKEARKQQQHKREKKDKTPAAAGASESDDADEDGGNSARPARDGTDQPAAVDEEDVSESKRQRKKKKHAQDRAAEEAGELPDASAAGDRLAHKKKRKHREEAESGQGDENCNGEDGAQRKKQKAAECTLGGFDVCPLNEPLQDIPNQNGSKKYSIPETCLAVVRKHGEISLKKLKKKVVADYLSNASTAKYHTEEKLSAKIEKAIKSNPELALHRDTVKLRLQD